ncbi:MAG: rhomboid family intramembrane serine protease [Saprospiraceae bacterium]
MEASSIIGTIIAIFTGLVTYKGLRDYGFKEMYLFDVDKILIHKEYRRLWSSGFLHANWLHYGFNMMALLSFSFSLEFMFGTGRFLLLYFASMIGGSLLALFIHRNHGDYRALGASGAISGVIFSSIVLFPESKIGFVILPFEMKSWIFGVLYMLISILGIKSQRDNIGHEAHLGGAIIGVVLTLIFYPTLALEHWWVVLLILLPVTAFLILIVRNPAVLMIDKYWGENVEMLKNWKPKPSDPNRKLSQEEELDALLDKINKYGINSLSKKEKDRLKELTDKM